MCRRSRERAIPWHCRAKPYRCQRKRVFLAAEHGTRLKSFVDLSALTELLLPLDEPCREEVLVHVADPLAYVRGENQSHSRAIELDADTVLMAVGGLAQGMLQGYSTRRSAEEFVEHLLDGVRERGLEQLFS